MTKTGILFTILGIGLIWACQNEPRSEADIQYDHYYDTIMLIHDRTMPLMGKIENLRSQLKKERQAVINTDANRYRKVLNLLGELNKAENAMFTWMHGFKPDSVAQDDRLNYIQLQLNDVKHMEGLMLGSIGMSEMYLEEYGSPQQ